MPPLRRFDALQKMSAPPLRRHDACGAPVRKLMSAGAFAFKGSGFHATDYRKAPSCAAAKGPGCAACPAADS